MRGWLAAAIIVSAVALAGCGGSSSTTSASGGSSSTTSASVSSGSATTATQTAESPVCDQFCLQAGPSGGPNPNGCRGPNGKPYSSTSRTGCLSCPKQGCLDVLSAMATATHGIVPVRLRCLLNISCDGALLILQPNDVASPYGALPRSQWVGGSGFHLPPSTTGTVEIGLTPLGQRLASSAGGYKGLVAIQLKVYGSLPWGSLLIHS